MAASTVLSLCRSWQLQRRACDQFRTVSLCPGFYTTSKRTNSIEVVETLKEVGGGNTGSALHHAAGTPSPIEKIKTRPVCITASVSARKNARA